MSNTAGMGGMGDTLGFIKQLWGNLNVPGMSMPKMSIPGMVMPTLSIDEINQQIADLKAVESWLNLNMNMLRSTIQALEVQSATLSALKSMGESFSNAARMPQRDTSTAAGQAQATSTKSETRASAAPEPEMEPEIEEDAPEAPPARPASARKGGVRGAKRDTKHDAATEGAARDPSAAQAFGAEQMANPAMWWSMLQDQFKQAVTHAMSTEPGATSEDPKQAVKASAEAAPAKARARQGSAVTKPKATRKPAGKTAGRRTPVKT